jgi:lipopolysaccharide heptosyltransferase II
MYCDKAILGPGNIEVAGWAISTHGIDRVEVYCKDNLLGHASCGSLRPDVQAVYPFIKNSDKSGFTFYADFVRIQPSPEKYPILVRAIAKDGKIGEIELFLDEPDLYKNYLERTTPNEGTLHWMREISVRLSVKPSISLVLIAKEETLPFLACSLDSVMAQTYPFWNILLFCEKELPVDILQKIHPLMDEDKLKCYPLSDRGVSLNMIQGDFLGFIRSGDILAPHALFEMVKKINVDGPLDLIYTDEDTLIDGHRKDFFFKPDWSPDLLFSMNYIGQFFLLSRECFIQAGGFHHEFSSEAIYDLLFRVTEHTQIIGHVPLVLYTKNSDIENFPQGEKKVIEESLSRQGYRGEVIPLTEKGTSWRVRREIIGNPKVSIIILTAYKKPDLFRNCLRSIIEKSTYSNYEIILIDHSFGKLSQKDLEQLFPVTAFKVIKYNGNFNFSHMNNLGAENASGDYLILLNDDTEVITPGWIEAMLEHAQQSHIGVVGIKLFYPDEAIQHGGVFLADTGGGARHAFRFFLRDSDGYCGFLKTVRNCSAVTFACVMIPKKVYLELKGLDENLRVECNDVDFCLRANEAGYRVVWTPFALLYHRELATREKINFKDDTSFFWNRWQHLLEKGDPYYNSSLTLDSDDFSLNPRPVIIEHHEPYLPSGFKVRYHKNSVVDPESIRRILAVKLDHIGDVILSLPAIKMLQTRFPKAHITMLIGKWAKPIVEKFSQIDDILTFDFFFEESEKGKRKLTTKEMKHLGNMLQSHNFDLAIDLRRHHETREILKLSGARYLAGYCTGGDDDWLTMSLELSEEIQDIATQSNKLHITAQLCQLVQALTTKHPSTEPPIMSIPKLTLEKELPSVERYSHLLQAKFLVGIHPGAGGPLKQWPIPYFSRLADLLIERFDAQVVLFGGKKEKQPVSQIFSQMKHKGKAVSLAGETSLEEFMAAVRYCHLFIGNDSGPCHIAGILDVPTLAIFSGEVLPHEWHPLGEKTLSIRLDVPCSPCYKAYVEQCPFDLKCMKFLWPEKVYKGSQQLLGSL